MPLIRCSRETFSVREISHVISHAGYARARGPAELVGFRVFVDRRGSERDIREKRERGKRELSGEHVRSFRDSCLEFATREESATACRKREKKLPAWRGSRQEYWIHPGWTPFRLFLFLPLFPAEATYSFGEQARQWCKALKAKRKRCFRGRMKADGGEERREREKGGLERAPVSRATD